MQTSTLVGDGVGNCCADCGGVISGIEGVVSKIFDVANQLWNLLNLNSIL